MKDHDDNFQALEDELRKLKPAEPSADLQKRVFEIFEKRILDAFDKAPPNVEKRPEPKVIEVPQESFLQWFRPIAAAAAVLAVFLGALFLLRGGLGGDDTGEKIAKAPKVIDSQFLPVKAGNVIQRATDEGVILNQKGEPVRRVRYEYTDRYQWIDENGTLIELQVPQERQLHVPLETD